jgi:hypothetical protein
MLKFVRSQKLLQIFSKYPITEVYIFYDYYTYILCVTYFHVVTKTVKVVLSAIYLI